MTRTRRNRQLAKSSMILNKPTTGGRFRPSKLWVDPEAEAARIHRSTQLAVDYGMLPPRAGRPIQFAFPPQTPNTGQSYEHNQQNQQNSIEDTSLYQPAIAHARYHWLEHYAAQRQQRNNEWQMLVNQATSTYLHFDLIGLLFAMDGNYQQRHYAYASKDNPSNNQYPPIFLKPSKINLSITLCKETEVHVAGIDDLCAASHKVVDDLRDSTTWEKCDDCGLFEPKKDELLKIWHTKTKLRQKFLALIEEKQPLTQVCHSGEQFTLGTLMQQKLLEALRKQAKQLHNVLNKYVKRVQEFAESFPDRAHPIIINYNTLMQIDSDNAFWNDGLFTNQNEPWAVDPNTQKGIQLLASLDQGLEERQIGWEIRRVMKWAIQEHSQLFDLIREFTGPTDPNNKFCSLTEHPTLQSLSPLGQTSAGKALVHVNFVHICNLQLEWNHYCLQVLNDTTSQEDNSTIRCQWSDQMTTLCFNISHLPGDNNNLLAILEGQAPQLEDQADQAGGNDGDESDDENYLNEIKGFINQTMIDELANEGGLMNNM
ncbi:hypothetical protein PCASD_14867 [Puccinia coronata f. sp. avenae]|uniref:CxC1-like cysteine cluster associated with KDZ transposases domain-containing protein n=1 Tax=Puccinia coronata f. sp. avenae TaxID=200324 RepID=A0A2N5TZR7_9BASI|nr:hypothetical protein PCASD_14867 [Puccinia coronata f. sp. avenae]